MQNEVKVSVVMAVQGVSQFLPEALASIKEQTFEDYELIVVDDTTGKASGFRIMALELEVARHGFRNAKVLWTEGGRGPAAARNVGIRAAKGEYVCFLDHDDLFDKGKLETQVFFMGQHPEFGMVYTDEYQLVDGKKSQETAQFTHAGPSGWIFRAFLERSFIAIFTVMLRREVLKGVGMFDESLRYDEDDDLWRRIMLRHQVGFMYYPAGTRRLHDSNMSRDRSAMIYYQFQSWLKIKLSEPGAFRANEALFRRRAWGKLKSYLKYCLRGHKPDLKVLEAFYQLVKK